MAAALDDVFREATSMIKSAEPSSADKLKLYALFKAQTGAPLGVRPGGLLNVIPQAKWDARKALGDCSEEEAKRRYIALVKKICPEWLGVSAMDDIGRADDEGDDATDNDDGIDEEKAEDDDIVDESDAALPVREVKQALFNQSLAFYKKNRALVDAALLDDEVLELYSCFKIVTVGSCTAAKPGYLSTPITQKRWSAWSSVSTEVTDADARVRYVALVAKGARQSKMLAEPEWAAEFDPPSECGVPSILFTKSRGFARSFPRRSLAAAMDKATDKMSKDEHTEGGVPKSLPRPKSRSRAGLAAEVSELRLKNRALARALRRCEREVSSLRVSSISKSGFLYKHRERMFGSPWNLRYFQLDGATGTLRYFQSAETAFGGAIPVPRFETSLEECELLFVGDGDNSDAMVREMEAKVSRARERAKARSNSSNSGSRGTVLEDDFHDDAPWHDEPIAFPPPSGLSSSSRASFFQVELRHKENGPLLRIGAEGVAEAVTWVALMRDVIDSCEATARSSASSSNTSSGMSTRDTDAKDDDYGPATRRAEDGKTKTKTTKKSQGKRARSRLPHDFHKEARPSLLSSGAAHTNYRGFFNLSLIVLFVMNLRLIIENILKYGLIALNGNVARQSLEVSHLRDKHPGLVETVVCALLLNVPALLCLGIERWAASAGASAPEPLIFFLHAVLTTSVLAAPCAVVTYYETAFGPGAALIFLATVLWLKLVSFAHTNGALRQETGKKSTAEATATSIAAGAAPTTGAKTMEAKGAPSVPSVAAAPVSAATADPNGIYPQNLTVGELYFFFALPTLCYQTKYPRTGRIRKRWLARRVCELALCLLAMAFITEQYTAPTVANARKHVKVDAATGRVSFEITYLLERLLKLCIPSLYTWLLMFYALFHLWLNILAELTRFGDRLFYRDWWNANTIDRYWRDWNLPVHNWLARHLYFPLLNAGAGKLPSQLAVFLVSAFFHELLVSVPLHMVRFHAFVAMMAQIPLGMATKRLYHVLKRNDAEFKGEANGTSHGKEDGKNEKGTKRKSKSSKQLIMLDAVLARTGLSTNAGNFFFWLIFCVVGQPMVLLLYFFDYWTQPANLMPSNSTLIHGV